MRTGIIACLIFLTGCAAPPDRPVVIQGMTMGTNYTITLSQQPERPIEILQAEIDATLKSINLKMSTYLSQSELSIINQTQSQDWLPLSPELYEVISTAMEFSHLTNGAFDITVGKLVNLWGFGPGEITANIPEELTIKSALKTSGYQHIDLKQQPYALKKGHPAIYLDLSGIAKGYAVDRIYDLLDQQGFSGFLVDIGGEVKAKGVRNNQAAWRIGVEKPMVEGSEIQRVVNLSNQAMATSGDYRNYIVHNGKRFSHTIDPRTGRPIPHELLSVSVVDGSAMVADALATALLVMGTEKGIEFAEQKNITAYFIKAASGTMSESYTRQFLPYLSNN